MVVEHDMDVVLSISDHIVVMHQGKVLAQGTPAEIRANAQVQEAYLGGGSTPTHHEDSGIRIQVSGN